MDTFPFEQASRALGVKMYEMLSRVDEYTKSHTQEIRLRAEGKICLRVSGELKTLEHMPKISCEAIAEAFESICGYSVYAHQQEIAGGFVTVKGGHRAGICGTAVTSNGKITMLRGITSINLRIARSFSGCSAQLFDSIDSSSPCGILIAGPPMSGKTTLLRDIAAALSGGRTGRRYAVSVLDERGELAAVHDGIPQYDFLGACDVLSGYPKGQAIISALRSMSPEIIVCDEIGTTEEAEAVSEGINAGVSIIASVHTDSKESLLHRPVINSLIATGAFRYVVILDRKPFGITEILKTEDIKNEACGMYIDNASVSGDRGRNATGHTEPMRIA